MSVVIAPTGSLTRTYLQSRLKRLRDATGRNALSRAARTDKPGATASGTMTDFQAALDAQRSHTSLAAA